MMTSGRALCAKNRSVAAGSSGLMMTSGRALCAKNRSVAAGNSGLMMTSGRALCAKNLFRRSREQWVDDD